MPYPPTVPPTTRVNSTPQADNHPLDHNQLSQAITDMVNKLGTNPVGGADATTTATLSRHDTALGQLARTGTIAPGGAMLVVTPYNAATSKLWVVAGNTVQTTDAASLMRLDLGFNTTGGIRYFSAQSGDPAAFEGFVTRYDMTIGWVTVKCRNYDGTLRPNTYVRLDYVVAGWDA